MKYYPIGGWNTYKFLVTPQELKEILRGFTLLNIVGEYHILMILTVMESVKHGLYINWDVVLIMGRHLSL